MKTLVERKARIEDRIESIQSHITNLRQIGGEGRLALAYQFEDKVSFLKQRLYELNLEGE